MMRASSFFLPDGKAGQRSPFLLLAALVLLAVLLVSTPSAQAQSGQPEPQNVQITPEDGALTVTWDVSPREGFEDHEIRHALRWSQESGVWANPDPDPDTLTLSKNDGIAVAGGLTSYTITGLQNGVATGVFVRSFVGDDASETANGSSRWVRVKGDRTMPGPVPQQLTPPDQQAQQQTQQATLWSATLTPKVYGTNPTTLGCATGFTEAAKKCSTATTLTDNNFVLGGTTYTITDIIWEPQQTVSGTIILPNLRIHLDKNVPAELISGYSLTIGTEKFAPRQFSVVSGFPKRFSAARAGLTLTLNSPVTLSLQQEAVGAPDAPTGLALSPGDGQLTASWTAPASDGGSAITGYDVEYKTNSATDQAATTANDPTTGWTDANVSVSGTTATITNLTNGTAYDVRVRAKNSAGDSPWSTTATETPASQVQQSRCASQSTDANSPLIRDCRTLIDLKGELDPNNKLNWAEDTALGSWGGVTSSAAAGVTELRLSNRGLGGIVPAGLGQLPSLRVLALDRNSLSGEIPAALGDLSELRELALWSNGLSGRIPSELGQPANMLGLSLGNNQLSGAIPVELGQLGKLQLLSLSRNQLDGSIPHEFGQLTSMTRLYLYDNNLSGSIPAGLGQLTGLTRLYLYDNNLSGSIPTGLGQLTGLTRLYLHNNSLSGSIPAELGNLAALEVLSLWRNQLTGEIPSELGQLTALRDLALSKNRLSGAIPVELGQLANLLHMNLNTNSLSGPIPTELGGLSTLRTLTLYANELTGSIPPELGQLASLEHLALSQNQLSGQIPAELGSLAALEVLSLWDNELSGSIPGELGQLTNLEQLMLNENQLDGQIPAELGNLAALQILYMWRNQLSGSIPGELGQMTALRELWLSRNRLSGLIPTQLGNLAALQELALSRNRLTGSIPASLGNLAVLQVLRLACNDFSGAVPTGIGDLSELTEIDLHGNPRLLLGAADLPGNLVRQGREVVLSGPCEGATPTTPATSTTPTTPTDAVASFKWAANLSAPNQGRHTGCDNSGANKCSSLLAGNWFNYYDRKYTVQELSLRDGELRLRLDRDVPPGMRSGGYLRFHVSRDGFADQQPVVLELPGDSDFAADPKLLKWTGVDGHWNGRHHFSLYTYPQRDPQIRLSVSPAGRDFAEGTTAEVTITIGPRKGQTNVAVNIAGDAQVREDYGVELRSCIGINCKEETPGFDVLPGGLLARQYTFGASTTEQTVTFNIDIEDDAESEGEESLVVSAGIQFSGRNDPHMPEVYTPEFDRDQRDSLTLRIPANDKASFTVSPRSLNVNEGGTASYTVALSTRPTANVIVAMTTSSGLVASFSPARLTFTPSNWQTPQQVTVTGQQDADSNDETATITHERTSDDPKYKAAPAPAQVTVFVSDDEGSPAQGGQPGALQQSPGQQQQALEPCPVATEPPVAGQKEPYNVCVTPGDGTLTVTWSVAPRAGVADGEIRHALRWSQESGVWANPEDPGAGGPEDGIAVESGVTSYTITGLENDVATGVFVRSFVGGDLSERSAGSSKWVRTKGDRTTPRAGQQQPPAQEPQQPQATPKTFSVSAAASAPEGGNALLTVTLSEAAPAGGVELTVTAGYSGSADSADVGVVPQTVTVAAGEQTAALAIPTTADAVDEEDETFTVTVAASTQGWESASAGQDTATVTILDDDTAGVTITPTSLSIAEGGSTSYSVVLDSRPTAEVTITAVSSDPAKAAVLPASFTIGPENWNVPEVFAVNGVSDADTDDESVGISHSVTSSDGKYASVPLASVSVAVTDITPPPAQEQQQQQQAAQEPPTPGQLEPYNIRITPGDGTLTVTWTVAPRDGFDDDEIRHALRWSQVSSVWANPLDPQAGGREDGVSVAGGVYSYTITGLQNGVATGVFVRSFTGDRYSERVPASSKWVRIKGDDTTPRAE